MPAEKAHLPIFDARFLPVSEQQMTWFGQSQPLVEMMERPIMPSHMRPRTLILFEMN